MDKVSRSILGYQVSTSREPGPCILTIRMAFDKFKKFRPFMQFIERFNHTFKESYGITCGYGTESGAVHNASLWVAYYNFLRPHELSGKVELLEGASGIPDKWQLLIFPGRQEILKLQRNRAASCS